MAARTVIWRTLCFTNAAFYTSLFTIRSTTKKLKNKTQLNNLISASDSFTTMALYKSIYFLTYSILIFVVQLNNAILSSSKFRCGDPRILCNISEFLINTPFIFVEAKF